jgi:lysophospholipase L1-like esterase
MTATEQSSTHRLKVVLSAGLAAAPWVFVCAAFWYSYRFALQRFATAGPAEFRAFIASVLVGNLPDRTVLTAVGCFLMLTLARLAWRSRRKLPLRSAFWTTVPLFLTAVLFPAPGVFRIVLLLTVLAFLMTELQQAYPWTTDAAESAPDRRLWLKLGLLALATTPFIVGQTTERLWALFFWLASYAVVYAAVGFRPRLFVRHEGPLLALLLAVALAVTLLQHARRLTDVSVPALALLGFATLNFILLRARAKQLRFPNAATLAAVLLGLMALEIVLAPVKLETRALPGSEGRNAQPLETARPAPGAHYLATLKRGVYNSLPAGWFVEVGRIRGARPSVAKPPHTFRVITQGSSSTEGAFVKRDQDTWPAALERKLNELRPPYHCEVINAGIGGSTTFGMLLNLKYEMLKYSPDLVILYVGHNDQLYARGPLTEREMFELALRSDASLTSLAGGGAPSPADARPKRPWLWTGVVRVQALLSHSTLYRLLRRNVLEIRDIPAVAESLSVKLTNAVTPMEFVDNLGEFSRLCKRHRIQLALVGEASLVDLTRYESLMAEVAEREHTPFVNTNDELNSCVSDPRSIFVDDVHLTPSGNDCVAEIIKKLLVRSRVLPERAP